MKRNEQLEENTWNISDLFKDTKEWNKEFKNLKSLVNFGKKYKGHILEPEMLLNFLEEKNKVYQKFIDLFVYAECLSDQDTSNNKAKEMLGNLDNLNIELSENLVFYDIELKNLTSNLLEEFYKKVPKLKEYDTYFRRFLKAKEHILSEAEEDLLAKINFAGDASDIYSTFKNSELNFNKVKNKDGEEVEVSESVYGKLIESKDRVLRENAYEEILTGYGKYQNTFASTFNSMLKAHSFSARVNKYKDSLALSMEPEEIPEEVYKTLIDTIHENLHLLQRFLKLKEKYNGLDKTHMYDLFIPSEGASNKEYSFEEAKEIVMDGLKPLGEEYLTQLNKGLNERWCDIYPNDFKRSGAYSNGASSTHPFVLLNYTNTLGDISTLAHEMGHAMHSFYSNKYQPLQYRDYVIFVAEVASTCNEALLINKLIEKAETKEEKISLLDKFISNFRTTVFRQTMFAEFELITHEKAFNGETLTAEKLNEIYYNLNKLYYGDEVFIDDYVKYEWSRIPHFYTPFYVYKYSTGFISAVALSNKILNGSDKERNDYLNFLKGGCSTDPISLLKGAGVDISKKESMEDAFLFMGKLIDEYEELTKKD